MSPIIDLMIRIKNGYMAGNAVVVAPYSTFSKAVLEKLAAIGYVGKVTESGEIKKELRIELRYNDEQETQFTDVEIVSKPGQRIYVAAADLKPVMSGFGYAILSTPKGILTNVEAYKQHIGGEMLFKIW